MKCSETDSIQYKLFFVSKWLYDTLVDIFTYSVFKDKQTDPLHIRDDLFVYLYNALREDTETM